MCEFDGKSAEEVEEGGWWWYFIVGRLGEVEEGQMEPVVGVHERHAVLPIMRVLAQPGTNDTRTRTRHTTHDTHTHTTTHAHDTHNDTH